MASLGQSCLYVSGAVLLDLSFFQYPQTTTFCFAITDLFLLTLTKDDRVVRLLLSL